MAPSITTDSEHLSETAPLMGGTATITVVGGSKILLAELFQLAVRCESLWSRFVDDSDLSRVNRSDGRATVIDPLTVELIRRMRHAYLVTGGDFDPTLLPALVAAGYAHSVVDSARVTTLPPTAVAPGELSALRIDGTSVTVGGGTTLDAGGIGKGFAADLVCQAALVGGARGAMAQISGDIVVVGEAPHDSRWHLAVEDPFDLSKNVAVVRLRDAALVTSSQRKRRWHNENGSSHHLIDPRTGTSAITPVQTATVIAATGAHAEALTKPAFLRAPADYLAWLPSVGAAGLVVLDDASILRSDNWEQYL